MPIFDVDEVRKSARLALFQLEEERKKLPDDPLQMTDEQYAEWAALRRKMDAMLSYSVIGL